MDMLAHRHLTTLALDVDFAAVVPIGAIPAGHRGIAPVTGGRCTGERLSGTVLPGHDWFVTRADGVLVIDVRLTLKTGDGATIYIAYTGRMVGRGDAMARFRKGERLAAEDYSLIIVAKFECGDPRYAWLNDAIVVGTGAQTVTGPIYTLFEIGR
ncbi:DUF3237 domain-containing protein [Sphingomonas sp. SUN039]|uniref:DUF3237 domain-containing protein n=1 Tax=Sphingomonas sp. SUN039 TaxID=2937787 RepID=UPI0021641ED9|nr:DUF3237 domain-containing protein [Sphingomonas sp. SUN039]UVO53468.1 DUF3237 domain-containing protein [Sphingomonas sp. SUN039]